MPRTLVCSRCGAEFECRGTADCWCSSVLLDAGRAAKLSKQSKDCVCRNCLVRA